MVEIVERPILLAQKSQFSGLRRWRPTLQVSQSQQQRASRHLDSPARSFWITASIFVVAGAAQLAIFAALYER